MNGYVTQTKISASFKQRLKNFASKLVSLYEHLVPYFLRNLESKKSAHSHEWFKDFLSERNNSTASKTTHLSHVRHEAVHAWSQRLSYGGHC